MLKNGYLEVTEKEKLFWKAHGDWYVQDIEIADITGNGKPNLILQFMSTDNFASHIPFWHKKREKGLFSHIFIYEYRQGRLKCIWGSSALNRFIVLLVDERPEEVTDIQRYLQGESTVACIPAQADRAFADRRTGKVFTN